MGVGVIFGGVGKEGVSTVLLNSLFTRGKLFFPLVFMQSVNNEDEILWSSGPQGLLTQPS